MIREILAPGEYYHIFNRGNKRQSIFKGDRDRARLLYLILHYQANLTLPQIGRRMKDFVQHRMLDIDSELLEEIMKERLVELTCFALMDNHFHLLVKELKEGGVSKYMQKIQNSYTKYFNTKYETDGHLLQGAYKVVHVESNDQLLYLSTYIHRNPREYARWKKQEHQYPWSSYKDYLSTNRWDKLLSREIIFEQFKDEQEYREFVETSGAKELYQDSLLDNQDES